MLYFTSPWPFYNYQLVLLNLFPFFTLSPYSLPLWQPSVCSMYLWVCFCFVCLFILFCGFHIKVRLYGICLLWLISCSTHIWLPSYISPSYTKVFAVLRIQAGTCLMLPAMGRVLNTKLVDRSVKCNEKGSMWKSFFILRLPEKDTLEAVIII